MMMIFYLGYLLPLLILLFLVVFFDNDFKTVGDILDYSWIFITPIANIFFICAFLCFKSAEFLEKRINFSFIKRYWDKFVNIKLKRL
jgi:hypothetical protein